MNIFTNYLLAHYITVLDDNILYVRTHF